MKNVKLFAVMVMLIATNVLAANNDPKPVGKTVVKQLSTILGTPAFKVTEDDILANVRFMVNLEGEIVVLTVKAENDIVEEYIKSRMNYKKVEGDTLKKGEEYVVDVRIVAK
ncbi:hypothetical protein [Galbibacter pacificus]|uniref:Uncharacterized protein n=1 Tax=Galbibacter pacificus TaxID=2996052 RepID=A0ABT6FUK5_9FLAO|nr:hypothetical protein [Galbibacter pacificus]MDG3583577.1 hypothetical protein [Galbibacter pacificus]MDG3586947.1 hypothetical protein [Galbibacter pacificus]